MGFVAVPLAISMPQRETLPSGWHHAIKLTPMVTIKVIEPELKILEYVEPEPVMELASLPPTVLIEIEPEKVVTDPVNDYLCEVYARSPTKRDGAGDFTWKDKAAAKRQKMDVCSYAINGMNRDFREQLYAMGQAADKSGIKWTMLSAFRDDYRQSIASGTKARTGYSMHGGSKVTGGHGDGRAVDIDVMGSVSALFKLIDTSISKFGLYRPYKGFDPNHVQPTGAWRNIAMALRFDRTGVKEKTPETKMAKVTTKKRYAKSYKKKVRYARRHRARA